MKVQNSYSRQKLFQRKQQLSTEWKLTSVCNTEKANASFSEGKSEKLRWTGCESFSEIHAITTYEGTMMIIVF